MSFGFGFIPDLLRGKSFNEALTTNAKQGAMVGLAAFGLPALTGTAGAGAAAPGAAGVPGSTGALGTVPSLAPVSYGLTPPPSSVAAGGDLGLGGSAAATGGMKGFSAALKPYGDAAASAGAIKGLLQGDKTPPPQTQGINPMGAQTLAQLAQQGQPQQMQRRQTIWG